MNKNKELLFSVTKKDLEIQTFRSGGPGGQNQNKVSSGVRIIHRDSGAIGESREERSQLQNKKNAFIRLTSSPKFQAWVRLESARRTGMLKNVEELVQKQMSEKNIKVEYIDNDYSSM